MPAAQACRRCRIDLDPDDLADRDPVRAAGKARSNEVSAKDSTVGYSPYRFGQGLDNILR
jgi:hypothetical protein